MSAVSKPSSSKSSSRDRVRAHRARMRAQGMRLVQMWVRDTRTPEFKAEAARQSRLVAAADAHDPEMEALLEAAWADIVSDAEK